MPTPAHFIRPGLQRRDAPCAGGAFEASVGLHPGSRHGKTADPGRGKAGSAGAAAEDLRHAAHSFRRSNRSAMRARPSKAISEAACSRHIGATPRSLNRRQPAIGRPALTIHSPDICSSQPKWPRRQFNLASRIPIEGTREYGLITALDSRTNKQRVAEAKFPIRPASAAESWLPPEG